MTYSYLSENTFLILTSVPVLDWFQSTIFLLIMDRVFSAFWQAY